MTPETMVMTLQALALSLGAVLLVWALAINLIILRPRIDWAPPYQYDAATGN
jgi:hypothetical protein